MNTIIQIGEEIEKLNAISSQHIANMDIRILKDQLKYITDKKFASIIELITDAVNDYPLSELNDTEIYFSEVRSLMQTDVITYDSLKLYLYKYQIPKDNDPWVISSINSLLEAFDLMRLYEISYEEVLAQMEKLKS